MKKAVLLFPNCRSIADFLLSEKRISNAEVNSRELTLIAPLDERQVSDAEKIYGAILKAITPRN